MRVEKTVFISYRRTNVAWALAIYQYLSKHGYDAFFDFSSLDSGDFEQAIIGNIKARAHFLVILTPSALERCDEPNDWLRREIETAIDEKRNIIPVFLEGFSFSSPSIAKYLTGKLALLSKYNGVDVPVSYFDEAMERIRNRYLNIPLDLVLHPASSIAENAATSSKEEADKEEKVDSKELTAQEWFEKGIKHGEAKEYDEAIRCYSEAIRLNPNFASSYNNRGVLYRVNKNIDKAITDFNEAVRLDSNFPEAHYNRGNAHQAKENIEDAIKDYNEAIRLSPNFAEAYNNRGVLRQAKENIEDAIKDYNEAIRLNPNDAEVYYNRGIAYGNKGDIEEAIKDFNKAIHMKPHYVDAFNNRGIMRKSKGDIEGAIEDFNEAIRLQPDYVNAYNNLGNAYKDKMDFQSAKAFYQKALALDPNHKQARKNLDSLSD